MKKIFAQIMLCVWLMSAVAVAAPYASTTRTASPTPSPASQDASTTADFIPLRLRGHTFDPKHTPTANIQRTLSEESYGLRLVQFDGPIQHAWYAEMQRNGLEIVSYIPDYAYLVWGNGLAIKRLQTQTPLRWAGTYQPHYALHPELREEKGATEYVQATFQVYDHPGASQSISIILDQAEQTLRPPYSILVYQNLSVRIARDKLDWLSQLPDIVNIEPLPHYQKLDEIQGQIMAGHLTTDGTQPSSPGYLTWLTTTLGLSTVPDAYPIVDVTDDGIDDGDDVPNHPDFYQFGDTNLVDRLAYNHNWTEDASADGAGGHGNINAAIVAGYNDKSGPAYEDGQGYNYGLGINPLGRVAGSKIFENAGPYHAPDYATIISTSYAKGARISSNSWGEEPGTGAYFTDDQAYDALVRDAQATVAGNQEMLIVFAAGNSGRSGNNTIGSPGNAKNVITVGAAESYRPTWTDGCNVPASGADSAQDIIDFSSRGPTDDERVKPDLVAPGTHIQGAASMIPNYIGNFVCDAYHPDGQTLYAASSGTSHATPAVAGAASLFYRYYQDNFSEIPPSPAMTKAYLVNTARYLNGVGAGGTLPSYDQGFGEVNLGMAFNTTARILIDQSELLENSGDTYILQGSIETPSEPFRVTLAWTDAPGPVMADAYINNLDLEVTLNGDTYLGNVFSGADSITGGSADPRNNVESVFIPAGQNGTFTIKISGTNIAGDGVPGNAEATDQDFALVCYNCTQQPDFNLSVSPVTQNICSPNPAHYVISTTSSLDFQSPITLSIHEAPLSTTVMLTPSSVLPAHTALATITPSTTTLPGHYPMYVVGIGDSQIHTRTFQLELFARPSSSTTLLSPANAQRNVKVLPTLKWNAASNATSYKLEVAEDTTFMTPTYTASTHSISHVLTRPLEYNTTYYWRVTPRNICGSGEASRAYHFTTQETPNEFYRQPNAAIPDNDPSGYTDTLTLSSLNTLSDITVTLVATHTWVGDLSVTLAHSDTKITLIDRPGEPAVTNGCSGGNLNLYLNDHADLSAEDDCSDGDPAYLPDTAYRPNESLENFAGESANGIWQLHIYDSGNRDVGTLQQWGLIFDLNPTLPPTQTAPSLTVTPTTLYLTEGAPANTYTIALTPTVTSPLTISMITNEQVTVTPQSFTFQANLPHPSQTITVTAIDDEEAEGLHSSSITHTLTSTEKAYTELFAPTVTLQSADNDVLTPTLPPQLSFISEVYTIQKDAGSTPITVTLGTAAPTTITADYATYDKTALGETDYIRRSGTLTFIPDDIIQTFTLTILNNPQNVVSKSVSLALSNPYSATLIAPQMATLYILGYEMLDQHLYLPLVLKQICNETIYLP